MGILIFSISTFGYPIANRTAGIHKLMKTELPAAKFQFCRRQKIGAGLPSRICCSSSQSDDGGEEEHNSFEELRVPSDWLEPSKAAEESEWLRVRLEKWLDEEYCPEATNVEISKVAAGSFYKSLEEKRVDVGEILLKMAQDLESISYQESFHGAFSSANAAINLIVQRMLED